ncbi:MAG: phosphate-starvation-inducible PsiE family protein [Nitrospirota bacterium]|nr:phosphate-starvation-inducible PsiE family protein [Nitrospirota bacterium]
MNTFNKFIDILLKFMVPLVIIALILGIARVIVDLRMVFGSPTITEGFDRMITNILSLFVVIELLKSLLEYFDHHRIKLTFITDAALVFVLREIMIGMFQHSMAAKEILALSALILVIGGVRTLAVVFSPDKP